MYDFPLHIPTQFYYVTKDLVASQKELKVFSGMALVSAGEKCSIPKGIESLGCTYYTNIAVSGVASQKELKARRAGVDPRGVRTLVASQKELKETPHLEGAVEIKSK